MGFDGVIALDQVSMSAAQGEIVGVIGPNGAGKTTLFNVICGFVRAHSGTITYDGSLLEHHHPHDLTRLGIARTLQGVGLCAGLTVLENVMIGAQCATAQRFRVGAPGSVALQPGGADGSARLARDLLQELGVGRARDQFPASLPYPSRSAPHWPGP